MSEGRKKMTRVVMEQVIMERRKAFITHIKGMLLESGYRGDELLMIQTALIKSWEHGFKILNALNDEGVVFEYLPREST